VFTRDRFNTFEACIRHTWDRADHPKEASWKEEANYFKPPPENPDFDIFKVFMWLETNYKCSGFCVPDMFFYSMDIIEGLPTESCIQPLMGEFGGSFKGIGVAGVICGIILLLVFIFSYCLWKKYED